MSAPGQLESFSIEYLKTIDTPTLSNAIELLGVRPRSQGFAPLELRCLFPELGRLCGYAVTAQVETVTKSGRREEQPFLELFEAVADSPKPAVVVFQEIGAHGDYAAHCGEVMATVFKRLGAAGLISDCGVRDLSAVRALGFQCFARGTVASHAYFRLVRVGVPVQVLGLVIQPQDVLHGDENGLILVPKEDLEKIQQAVATVQSREKELMDLVSRSDFRLDRLRGRFGE